MRCRGPRSPPQMHFVRPRFSTPAPISRPAAPLHRAHHDTHSDWNPQVTLHRGAGGGGLRQPPARVTCACCARCSLPDALSAPCSPPARPGQPRLWPPAACAAPRPRRARAPCARRSPAPHRMTSKRWRAAIASASRATSRWARARARACGTGASLWRAGDGRVGQGGPAAAASQALCAPPRAPRPCALGTGSPHKTNDPRAAPPRAAGVPPGDARDVRAGAVPVSVPQVRTGRGHPRLQHGWVGGWGVVGGVGGWGEAGAWVGGRGG